MLNGFIQITRHLYFVKNQNGFNNALYNYFDTDESYTKSQVRAMVQNFTSHYPTAMVIIDQSFECRRVYLEFFNIKDIQSIK